eukprot:TRINITY_DN70265_c0_g1_i1.p1 TRINITY_DN70265_c0_g1~~TRINITY_DN70265_c0_g1_i1.p1  ORF type:complete len:1106 (+),score=297.21 TRINITY_DN70265_c0_g1_i1:86-3319(+)
MVATEHAGASHRSDGHVSPSQGRSPRATVRTPRQEQDAAERRSEETARRTTATLQQHQRAVQEHMKRVSLAVGQYDEADAFSALETERRQAQSVVDDAMRSPNSRAIVLNELAMLPPALPQEGSSAQRVAALESALESVPALSEALEELDSKAFVDGTADVIELAFETLRVIFADLYGHMHFMVRSLPPESKATVLQSSFRSVLRTLRSALAASHVGTERVEAMRWRIEDIEAENTKLRLKIKDLEVLVEKNRQVLEWEQQVAKSRSSFASPSFGDRPSTAGLGLDDGLMRASPSGSPTAGGRAAAGVPQAAVMVQVESSVFLGRVADAAFQNALKLVDAAVAKLCADFGGARTNFDTDPPQPSERYVCVFTRIEGAVHFAAQLQRRLLEEKWPQQLLYYAACRPVLAETGKPAPQGVPLGGKRLLWGGLRVRCAVHSGTLPPPEGDPPHVWYTGAVMQRLWRLLCSTPGGLTHVSARCWQAYTTAEGDGSAESWPRQDKDVASSIDSQAVHQEGRHGGDAHAVFPRELRRRVEHGQSHDPQGRFADEVWWDREKLDGSEDEGGKVDAAPKAPSEGSGSSPEAVASKGTSPCSPGGASNGPAAVSPALVSAGDESAAGGQGLAEEERESYEEVQQALLKQVTRLGEGAYRRRTALEAFERQMMAACDPLAPAGEGAVLSPQVITSVQLAPRSQLRQVLEATSSAAAASSAASPSAAVAAAPRGSVSSFAGGGSSPSAAANGKRTSDSARLLGSSNRGSCRSPASTSFCGTTPQSMNLTVRSGALDNISLQISELKRRLAKRQRRRFPPLQRCHGVVRVFGQLLRSHLHPDGDKGDVTAISGDQFMQTFLKKCMQGSKRETSVSAGWRELEQLALDLDEVDLPEEGQRVADSVGAHLAKTFQVIKSFRRRHGARGRQSLHGGEESSPTETRRQSAFTLPGVGGAMAMVRMRRESQRGSVSARVVEEPTTAAAGGESPAGSPGGDRKRRESRSRERSKSPQPGAQRPSSTRKAQVEKGSNADVDFVRGLSGMEARQRALQEKWQQRRQGDGPQEEGQGETVTQPTESVLPALSPKPSPL